MKNILLNLNKKCICNRRRCNLNTLLIIMLLIWNIFQSIPAIEQKQDKIPPADAPVPIIVLKDLEPEELEAIGDI